MQILIEMNDQVIIIQTIAFQVRKTPEQVRKILDNVNDPDSTDHQKVFKLACELGYFTNRHHIKMLPEVSGAKTTISMLAFILKLSSATVSRALNGSDRVNASTRARVFATAGKLGFERNQDARTLRKNKAGKATIADIADRSNLSVSTVSRCFTDSGEVSARTRHKVLQLASKIGFVPNEQARKLRRE